MNLSTLAFRMNEVLEVHQTFRPDEMVLLRVVIGKKTSMLPNVVSSFVSNMEEMMGMRVNEEDSMDIRLDEIDLAMIQQKTFFDNIPSGHVMAYTEISSHFGWRENPVLKRKVFHSGLDCQHVCQ